MNDIARCGKFQIEIKPSMIVAGVVVADSVLDGVTLPDGFSKPDFVKQIFSAMFAECKK